MTYSYNATRKKTIQPTDAEKKHSLQADELLTTAEVAAYLKLSQRTAWRWCKSGRLPAFKVGHQWRIAQSDLEEFVRRQGKLVI